MEMGREERKSERREDRKRDRSTVRSGKRLRFSDKRHLYSKEQPARDGPCIMHDTTVLNVRPNHPPCLAPSLSSPRLLIATGEFREPEFCWVPRSSAAATKMLIEALPRLLQRFPRKSVINSGPRGERQSSPGRAAMGF